MDLEECDKCHLRGNDFFLNISLRLPIEILTGNEAGGGGDRG